MVGRRRELERLHGLFTRLQTEGAWTYALIRGAAGMGKSMLMAAAAEEATRLGLRVITTRCDPVERATAYHPWHAVLLALGHNRQDLWIDTTGELRRKALLDMANRRISELIGASAGAERLVIFIDDVQWMDDLSWALIEALDAAAHPLVIVLAGRPQPQDSAQQVSEAQRVVHQIELSALTRDELAVVAARAVPATAIGPELTRLLYAQTSGNPMFAELLVRALQRADRIVLDAGSGAFEVNADGLAGLPATLQAAITGQLRSFDQPGREALQLASAIGRSFDLATLRTVLRGGQDPWELLRARTGAAAAATPTACYFRVAAVYEVVHGEFRLYRPGEFRRVHDSLAAQAEGLGSAPGRLRLAHHLEHAGHAMRSVGVLLAAAEAALERNANRDVLFLLEQIERLRKQENRRLPDDEGLRLNLLTTEARIARGEYERARIELCDLLERLGVPVPRTLRGLQMASLGEGVRQALGQVLPQRERAQVGSSTRDVLILRALNSLAAIGLVAVDMPLVGFCTLKAVGLGVPRDPERDAPTDEAALAHATAGFIYSVLGQRGPTAGYFQRQAARLFGVADTLTRGEGNAARGPMHVTRAMLHIARGDWTDAERELEAAITRTRDIGDHLVHGYALVFRGEMHSLCGRLYAASVDFRASAEEFRRAANLDCARVVAAQLARVDFAYGNPVGAILALHDALDPMLERRDYYGATLPLFGALLAAYRLIGDFDGAIAVARRLEPVIEGLTPSVHGFYRLYAGLVEVWAGYAERVRDDPAGQRQARRAAAAALRQLGQTARMFPIAAAAHLHGQGTLLALRGDRAGACAMWAQAAEQAQRLGLPKEQACALARLGAHSTGDEATRHRTAATEIFTAIGMQAYGERFVQVVAPRESTGA